MGIYVYFVFRVSKIRRGVLHRTGTGTLGIVGPVSFRFSMIFFEGVFRQEGVGAAIL